MSLMAKLCFLTMLPSLPVRTASRLSTLPGRRPGCQHHGAARARMLLRWELGRGDVSLPSGCMSHVACQGTYPCPYEQSFIPVARRIHSCVSTVLALAERTHCGILHNHQALQHPTAISCSSPARFRRLNIEECAITRGEGPFLQLTLWS
ncbi:hypothetical protein EV126DRAFT_123770 [Verticillium dahliae]|nr:hypothetical protein EV126DRAFT_123770 [Verticillium dahliae]